MNVELRERRVLEELVQHVRLLIVVRREDDIVDDVFQGLQHVSAGFRAQSESACLLALAVDVLLDVRRLPDLVPVLRDLEVRAVVQAKLDHEVVVLQLQLLQSYLCAVHLLLIKPLHP